MACRDELVAYLFVFFFHNMYVCRGHFVTNELLNFVTLITNCQYSWMQVMLSWLGLGLGLTKSLCI